MAAPLRQYLRLMRPGQWVKNVVVFAPSFFALWNASAPNAWIAAGCRYHELFAVFAAFCLWSSAVYVLNDLADAPRDRLHPRKRLRPVASGAVPPREARGFLALLLLLGGSFLLSLPEAACRVLVAYLVLQAGYTFALKRIPALDVACIAAGFVLRVVAGGFAAEVALSPWLLSCTFLLALFLALGKRRQEKALLGETASAGTRPALARLPLRSLDTAVDIAAAATIVGYAAYTQSPATIANFGSHGLIFTLPFVTVGLARYLHLLRRRDEGERPERVLLTDAPLLAIVLLFGISVAAVFHFRAHLP